MSTPPSSTQDGTIDVTPAMLWSVSSGAAGQQDVMHRGIKDFLVELGRYPDGGGNGTAVAEFTRTYKRVGDRFLDVWAKSVVSVGGAAVGFTVTANNYSKADAATHPDPSHQPATQPPPVVIDTPPDYGPITDFKWGDNDDAQSFVQKALEDVEDVVLDVLRPLLEHACRYGRAAEILPLPNHHRLNSVSETWRMPQSTLTMAGDGLTGLLSSITDQQNGEWYHAMRTFCSTLWGTSAWGQNHHGYNWENDSARSPQGANHPVFAVLFDTCEVMVDAVYHFALAAQDVRSDLHRIYRKAVLDSIPDALKAIDLKDGVDLKDFKNMGKGMWDLGKGFFRDLSVGIVLHLDEEAMNQAVDEYENRVRRQAVRVQALLDPLEEAYLSAPSYNAEEARAEAFGARALTEFKGNPLYTVPGDSEDNHRFPIDLANQEGIHNSHVIDKHVGKTDEQLAQRLRDQPGINAASTFTDLASAQKLTQDAMEFKGPPAGSGQMNAGVDNQAKIEQWLSRPRSDSSILRLDAVEFTGATGRTVDAGNPHAGAAQDTHHVRVVLKYKNGLEPPYVVYTSMPELP
ncbi:RNase A-like domain-containing protein [Streptomyces fragilis]|uniref:RNase A-like domain-containing protein n=1 Tax=Streptomyces fragilis TaxID=67301 RepID=A0ABV2YC48_9ACTN|nr:RNase A-like domain-containing protein [Streptomyces fragilis]